MDELINQVISIFWQPLVFLLAGFFLFKHLWGISSSLEKNYSDKIKIIRKRKVAELGIHKEEFCDKKLPLFDLNDEGNKPQMAEIHLESSSSLMEFRKKIQETIYWDYALVNLFQKSKYLSYISLGISIISVMVGLCLDILDWDIFPILDINSLLQVIIIVNLFLVIWIIFLAFSVYSIVSIERNLTKWDNEYYRKNN